MLYVFCTDSLLSTAPSRNPGIRNGDKLMGSDYAYAVSSIRRLAIRLRRLVNWLLCVEMYGNV
eukprot:230258-Heterocapsa_arctica.AAC.1